MAGRHRVSGSGRYKGTRRAPLFGGRSDYKGKHRPSFFGMLSGRQFHYQKPRPPGVLPAMWDQWGPYRRTYPTATYGRPRSESVGRVGGTFRFPFGGVT